jgi:squalene-associated FAD-dependent desaturase
VRHAHIVGAGLAGLSAACTLVEAGWRITLHEAGPAAGGRCRSYFDKALGLRIDNGNHLLLSGNDAAMAFLDRIGARDTMTGPGRALFPFMDLATGERWEVAPGAGPIPWWVLNPRHRVPGTRLAEYFSLTRLRTGTTVKSALGDTALFDRLLEPLAISALNTMPDEASARLMWAVVSGSLLRGGRACIPLVPRDGLSESFIDPALAWLADRQAVLHTGHRVSGIEIAGGAARALLLPQGPIPLEPGDGVVLAVPAWVAADLLPGLVVPEAFESILNVHFRIEAEPGAAGFVGLIGGLSEWVFVKPGIVSVTISAANRFAEMPAEEVALRCWTEVARVLNLAADMPPVRVIRERRATFTASPAAELRRPKADIGLRGLALAGDWTATGLPATIEGAITSGVTAAQHLSAA